MREDTYTPFNGNRRAAVAPMRVLRRFRKGRHVVEIGERKVTPFQGFEFIVFFDGQLQESQMFHGPRLADYPTALAAVAQQYQEGGWVEDVDALSRSIFQTE
jgi:hypothetical protein